MRGMCYFFHEKFAYYFMCQTFNQENSLRSTHKQSQQQHKHISKQKHDSNQFVLLVKFHLWH